MSTTDICCYRCGASLDSLSMPLSREDACPSCAVYLHVCKMCTFFDTTVPGQCREDDAEEVYEKERANFCEWFTAAEDSFDAVRAAADNRSRDQLSSLFGNEDGGTPASDGEANKAAEDLFK